jgi:hypothetical protein
MVIRTAREVARSGPGAVWVVFAPVSSTFAKHEDVAVEVSLTTVGDDHTIVVPINVAGTVVKRAGLLVAHLLLAIH